MKKRDLNELMKVIAPPQAYEYKKNGFSNKEFIQGLTSDEKIEVEDALIKLLDNEIHKDDSMIVLALFDLQSIKSIPFLKNVLLVWQNKAAKVFICSVVFRLVKDEDVIPIALNLAQEIKKENNSYKPAPVFDMLSVFKDERADSFIREFVNDKNILLCANAERALKDRFAYVFNNGIPLGTIL